ncbi:conserved protein of unknown function (plasmid) [Rhodovastum atsumiense]|uniref:Uncharacterized protein n=1 Tax=Rhodovastum atsumiense TaxID=504468 RepID=A0A5M6IWP5_9PROT|nr:hypothetical protein [Rhodovastum atsumiense]KAA5611888.1 hypothetical protein F1189_12715 [Rhodovastum atsumiense]CAH2606133.1 conserved protein of unknown function [Rhodovastum atsumiense]
MGDLFFLAVRGGRVVGEWETAGYQPPSVQPGDEIIRVSYATRLALDPRRGEDGLLPDPRTVGLTAIIRLAPLDFFSLFTAQEFAKATEEAMADPVLFGWLLRASGAQYIDLNDPLTEEGLDALVAGGVLTAARKARILSGEKPEAP